MPTEVADRNASLRTSTMENKEDWIHKQCGHVQKVPIEGGDIQCENCKTWVHLSPKKHLENKILQLRLDGEVASDVGNPVLSKVDLPFKMVTLKRRNQWDKLFDGFSRMKAISFVVQPVFLLEYFSKRGYEEIEILVGKGLTEQYKEKMSETKWQTVDELHERVSSDELKLWGSKDEVHTKLYILENQDYTRVITGSPNLSYKASGTGQTEFVVYWDFYPNIPSHEKALALFMKHYEGHFNDKCKLFMEDLSELFVDLNDLEPKEVIRIWKSNSDSSDLRGFRVIYDELSAQAMKETDDPDDDVITITIPKISQSKKKVLTDTIGAKFDGSDLVVSRKILQAESHLGIPQMKLDEETGLISVGVNGKLSILNKEYGITDLERV